MPIALQKAFLLGYFSMIDSSMYKLKHSFILKSKQRFLFYRTHRLYHKPMVKLSDEERQKMELARRIKEAIASKPRGIKKLIADKCDITPQAITGWTNTGSIDKNHIAVVADETEYNLHWLITGKGPKLKSQLSNAEPAPKLGIFRRIAVVSHAQLGDNGHWTEMEYPVGHGDGYILYPTKDSNAYAVRCKGDSMKPRIKNGEFVIVEPNREPTHGDDVLVKAKDGRVMVKTLLYIRDGRIHLISINETHPPQTIALEDVDKIHPIAAIVNSTLWTPD